MDKKFKVIAFDLDGTLTEHRTKLDIYNKIVLDQLKEKYKLIIVGAGNINRIFDQINEYPIDIIGNYGMQYYKYDYNIKKLIKVYDNIVPVNRDEINNRIKFLREKFKLNKYIGESVEYHESGCITFPLLGTKANINDKLHFDPDKIKRKSIYLEVKNMFPEYTTFIGGSSSFDFAPLPYNKLYALKQYITINNYDIKNLLYVGDDYKDGGNDEVVYKSDFNFQIIDNYKNFKNIMRKYL